MWSGASSRPDTALPMHRVWLRCSPRESVRKRTYALDEDDWEDVLPSACYRNVFLTLVALSSAPDAGSVGPHSSALLLGTCAPSTQVLGCCSLCDMLTCDCSPSFAVSIDRPPNTPDGLRMVSGLDLRVQNCWSERVKQEFGWAAVFNRIWHLGWKREQLASMYLGLPTEMRQVIGKLSMTLGELIEIKRSAMSKAILMQTFQQLAVGENDGTDLTDMEAGCVEDGELARLTTTYNVTNGERKGFHISRTMAHMMGFNYEEAIARVGGCQMSLAYTELEGLAMSLDHARMVASGHLSWTRYLRTLSARDNRPGVLVRAEFATNVDSLGRCMSTTWTLFPVSVEEFDRQLDTAAETVRPFMSVLGDHRRGQELLDDAKSDQDKLKVASLMQTRQGVQILKLFASVIDEELVSPVRASVSAARVEAQTLLAARCTLEEETSRSSRVNVREGSGQLWGDEQEQEQQGEC